MKTLYLLLFAAGLAGAQDFGYEYAMISEYRALSASYNLQSFTPWSSNPLPDSGRISFSTALPFIELRQNNGRIAVGYQTFSDLSGKSKASFCVYGETHSDFSLSERRNSAGPWYIPISVAVNYVRAEASDKKSGDFDIGSFGLGSGIKYKRFSRSFGIQAFVVGSIYYASEGFSTDYGTQTSICGEVQLIFSDILFEGVLIGYRYEAQRWNMSNSSLDYQRLYHGVVAGFLF